MRGRSLRCVHSLKELPVPSRGRLLASARASVSVTVLSIPYPHSCARPPCALQGTGVCPARRCVFGGEGGGSLPLCVCVCASCQLPRHGGVFFMLPVCGASIWSGCSVRIRLWSVCGGGGVLQSMFKLRGSTFLHAYSSLAKLCVQSSAASLAGHPLTH